MNNSDLLVALTLAITAIIFLAQTNDEILKLKISVRERWMVGFITCVIILLVNAQIFERAHLTFYFTIRGFYLTSNEWALLLFLFLIYHILNRVFNKRIYNTSSVTVFELIDKYKAEKNYFKLQTLLLQVIKFHNFEEDYAEKLNEQIFNDTHLIEYFAGNCPELLIKFSDNYPQSIVNLGDNLYRIFNGLFAEKNNPVFSEIRQYKLENGKDSFLDDWYYINYSEFEYNENYDYKTSLPIISWLVRILGSFVTHLKEDTSYFLSHFKKYAKETNNQSIYSADEIEKVLARDTIFNAIQLFRILLIELAFRYRRTQQTVDRVLLLFYSSWDFVEKTTHIENEIQADNRYGQEKVALNNDAYTINEYFLRYLFEGYCTVFILNKIIVTKRGTEEEKEKEDTPWIFHQLFRKVDSLIASEAISDDSKKYFIEKQVELYFDMPDFFEGETLKDIDEVLLDELNFSLKESPWGNSALYRRLFREVCGKYEFYRKNNDENIHRAQLFYNTLQPYTDGLEDRICDK